MELMQSSVCPRHLLGEWQEHHRSHLISGIRERVNGGTARGQKRLSFSPYFDAASNRRQWLEVERQWWEVSGLISQTLRCGRWLTQWRGYWWRPSSFFTPRLNLLVSHSHTCGTCSAVKSCGCILEQETSIYTLGSLNTRVLRSHLFCRKKHFCELIKKK